MAFEQHILLFGGSGLGRKDGRHNDLFVLDLTQKERPEWLELTSLACSSLSATPEGAVPSRNSPDIMWITVLPLNAEQAGAGVSLCALC